MSIVTSPSTTRIFHPKVESCFTLDKIDVTAYSNSCHQGILTPQVALQHAQRYADVHGCELRRKDRNRYITTTAGHSSFIHFTGPISYSMLAHGNANRQLRSALYNAGSLRDFEPAIGDERGNVIDPDQLVDISSDEIPSMCQTEAALLVEQFRTVYAAACRDILGIDDVRNIKTSLTSIEIDWDIACERPREVIGSFRSAFAATLLDTRYRPSGDARGPAVPPDPPEGTLIGFSRLFKLVAYPKLVRESGLGIARFEFKFEKPAIKKLLGSQVLPSDQDGIIASFGTLAAHAWPYLVELDAERVAPKRPIPPPEMLRVLGGCRNTRSVQDLLNLLYRERKCPVTTANRPILKKLMTPGWISRLRFSRPAYRKLAAGVDLSAWSAQS